MLQIVWNPSETLLELGFISLRWYPFCWLLGLVAAYVIVQRLYRSQRIADALFDPLPLYCFVGIFVGARLGHCLFYDPAYYWVHPIEVFLPIRETAEGWKVVGYAGLASHGGTLGLMIALWTYVKKTRLPLFRVLDNIAIATPITAAAIRMGNLMNSEIVGKPTDSDYGFIFVQNGESFARHPAQLYEALAYFALFLLTLWVYFSRRQKDEPRREQWLAGGAKELLPSDAGVGTGWYFGFCLAAIFTFRFFIEMLKEVQEPWELTMQEAVGINQGQLLSIPFALLGYYCLFRGWKRMVK